MSSDPTLAVVAAFSVLGFWFSRGQAGRVFTSREPAAGDRLAGWRCWFCDGLLSSGGIRPAGALWAARFPSPPRPCEASVTPPAPFCRLARACTLAGFSGAFVAGSFAAAYLIARCQEVSEVRPDLPWWWGRLGYHEVLLGLLLWATLTDLRDYTIPDHITLPGTLFATILAWASGDLQMIHLWVDWNAPLVELNGPEIPEWIRQHRHWHGLAWSVAGATTGALLIHSFRWLSRAILGRAGIGSGDATLMAMIGAFLGWQPVVLVFLLAPFTALIVASAVALSGRRAAIPYGPHLAASAWVVMMAWRWMWTFEPTPGLSVRRLFGDAVALGVLAAVALAGAAALLLGIRMYRAIPARRSIR